MAVYLVQASVTRKELYAAYKEKRQAKTNYQLLEKLDDNAIDYEPLAVAIAESDRFKEFLRNGPTI